MSISFPIDLPSSPAPKRITLSLITNVAISLGVYTFKGQKYRYSGQLWAAQVTLPIMQRSDAEEWNAFLLSLNGPEGTFRLGDPTATNPQGTADGAPVIDGGSQSGSTIATTGWDVSQTGALLAGDYIQIGTGLYKCKQDVDSDASGDANIEIWPDLRTPSPADGTTIVTTGCKGIFRLASNQTELFSSDETKLYEISFSAIEAI